MEPLLRLLDMFGGKLKQRNPEAHKGRPIWLWELSSRRSIEVMMTLYSLMSPRRKSQIENALTKWKAARLFKERGSNFCARGHKLEAENVSYIKYHRNPNALRAVCLVCRRQMSAKKGVQSYG